MKKINESSSSNEITKIG